jgi:hypothetical protein
MKKRNKKYNPHKNAKLTGRGSEFGAMSYDTDENGDMVTRCGNEIITLKELQALRQARKWSLMVCIFLKNEFKCQYQDQHEETINIECHLEDVAKVYVPDIALKLLGQINDNHYDYWGWHAEAL